MARFPAVMKTVENALCYNKSAATKKRWYLIYIWVLTYFIYTSYHLSRKPISVVKNVLNENCSDKVPPSPTNNSHWCDWKPFDGDNSSTLLGTLDSVFLFAYAFGMFFSGVVAERSRLNEFLGVGMVLSGIFTCAFGLGYTFNIHVLWYYVIVQFFGGLMQSSGWPGVVTVMGNWFGKQRRGLIMGVWNSHTSLGNILGTLIASAFLDTRWDLSFIVPGAIIGVLGVLVFFMLIPQPSDIGLESEHSQEQATSRAGDSSDAQEPLLQDADENAKDYSQMSSRSYEKKEEKPISFIDALKIPGVAEFSLSLFFSKLVSYTFLYWLPNFIFDNTSGDANQSGNISTFYDVGGIIGGILAGIMNDWTGMPASTCAVMLIAAMPMIYGYLILTDIVDLLGNMLLLIPVGLLVNGPYSLITTAVSAELGTHSSLQHNSKALSTVTSIIDGTGSIGAAVGPFVAGFMSNNGNWNNVFYMLIGADLFSLLFLSRLVKRESESIIARFRR